MAMTYASLTGNKTAEGSIKRDVNYEEIDPATIVLEAETLIYDTLRVREMRKTWTFGESIGGQRSSLPTGFLDPIGKLRDSRNFEYTQRAEDRFLQSIIWDKSTGTLGTDPFETTIGTGAVTVNHVGHGLNIDDVVTFSGATAGGGITIDGPYVVASAPSVDEYTITHSSVATSTDTTTGGSAVSYIYDKIATGQPCFWTIIDEEVQFDLRFEEARMLYMPYYGQPAALADTNTNFLCTRYPHILRTATRVRAHTWMKNWAGVQAELGILTGAIAVANARADLTYRGADIDQDNP